MATRTCKADVPSSQPLSEASHRLHTLLHTVRCIAQYEDQLCTLLHASRNRQRLPAAVRRDLEKLLDHMPAYDYLHDLEATRELLTNETGNSHR